MLNELHEMIKKGSSKADIASYIEKHPTSVNEEHSITKLTPIFVAAEQGNLEVFQYLIHRGSSINKVLSDGLTLMHLAASSGNVHIMQYLNANGLSYDVQANNGDTPFMVGTPEVKLYLYSKLKSRNTDLERENSELIEILEDRDRAIEAKDTLIQSQNTLIQSKDSLLEYYSSTELMAAGTVITKQPSSGITFFNQYSNAPIMFPPPNLLPASFKISVKNPITTPPTWNPPVLPAKPKNTSVNDTDYDSETPEEPDHKRSRNTMEKP